MRRESHRLKGEKCRIFTKNALTGTPPIPYESFPRERNLRNRKPPVSPSPPQFGQASVTRRHSTTTVYVCSYAVSLFLTRKGAISTDNTREDFKKSIELPQNWS